MLPQRVNLSGQWECGLVEILFPHSWYNVREEDAWFGIGLRNTDETEEIITARTRIEAGYYQGPQLPFVETINKALLRALPANVVRLSYSVVTHKMTLTVLSNVVLLGDMNTTNIVCRFADTSTDNMSCGPSKTVQMQTQCHFVSHLVVRVNGSWTVPSPAEKRRGLGKGLTTLSRKKQIVTKTSTKGTLLKLGEGGPLGESMTPPLFEGIRSANFE